MSITPRLDQIDFNYLINGGFRYWQRAGIASPVNTTTSFVYSAADRWLHRHTGTFTGTPNVQRTNASLPSNGLSQFALTHTFRRNAAAATMEHQQRIESIFSRKLVAAGKMSLSLFVNASLTTGSIRVRISYPTAVDNHASQTEFYNSGLISVSSASTWQEIALENIDVNANCVNGMAVFIEYSLPSGTDGADQTIRLTQVSLNSGRKASNFAPSGGDAFSELLYCQRYFYKSYPIDTALNVDQGAGNTSWLNGIWALSNGSFSLSFDYIQRMRAVPTITTYNPRSGTGTARASNDAASTTANVLSTSDTRVVISFPSAAGVTNYVFHIGADAEIS